jgi:hypothetical protein
MRSLLLLSLLSLSLLSCGDSQESMMRDWLSEREKLADVLESIDSNTKADELSKKLEPITEKLKRIETRSRELGEPSGEQLEKLMKQFDEARLKVNARLEKVKTKSISNIEILEIVENVMKNL